jgi:phage shock protein A
VTDVTADLPPLPGAEIPDEVLPPEDGWDAEPAQVDQAEPPTMDALLDAVAHAYDGVVAECRVWEGRAEALAASGAEQIAVLEHDRAVLRERCDTLAGRVRELEEEVDRARAFIEQFYSLSEAAVRSTPPPIEREGGR